MKSFNYHCLVPFHLADPAGVLFFGHAFSLFHQAYEYFVIHQLKTSWSNWFQNPQWIVPIRHAEANFLKPIHAGQECRIDISVDSTSSSSFILLTSIFQNEQCCALKTIHVFCNKNTKEKIAIPDNLIELLKN